MPAVDPGGPAGLLLNALSEGLSATKALSNFREAGGSIRTQTWYKLAGEVRAAVANRDVVTGLDPTLLPRDEHFTPWSAGSEGQFLYQVEVPYRDVESGEVFRAPYSVITNRVLSPQDAIDEALDVYADNAEKYGQKILGGILVGLYAMGG